MKIKLKGVAVASLATVLLPFSVNAAAIDSGVINSSKNSSSATATIESYSGDFDTDITIIWGDFKYNYDNGTWTRANEGGNSGTPASNEIRTANQSVKNIKANLSFASAIAGVTSTYQAGTLEDHTNPSDIKTTELQINNNSFTVPSKNTATVYANLQGGENEAVANVYYATSDKTIGTFTITIEDAE